MPGLTKEQIRHEVINLRKTLELLERTYEEEDWTQYDSDTDRNEKWLKSQSILTGIGHCRAVLQNVTPSDYDFGLGDRSSTPGQQFHDDIRARVDCLEREMVKITQDLKPRARRPNPILPTLQRPWIPSQESVSPVQDEKPRHSMNETLIPVDESELKEQTAFPLPPEPSMEPDQPSEFVSEGRSSLPSRLGNPSIVLLSPTVPSSSALSGKSARGPGAISGPLQTSSVLHDELSQQLAHMAQQLRRNAEQFSETLAKDEGVVRETQEKLERNYDEVAKERVRLRDHSVKSGYTTCFIFMTILVVIIAFFMTFLVIKVT